MNDKVIAYLKQQLQFSQTDIDNNLRLAELQNCSLIQQLRKSKVLSSTDFATMISVIFQVTIVKIPTIKLKQVDQLTPQQMYQHRILPITLEHNKLTVAMSDPSDKKAIQLLKSSYSYLLNIVVVNDDQLEKILHQRLSQSYLSQLQLTDVDNDSKLQQFIQLLLEHALQQNISDLHFESYLDQYRIRARQDGVLHTISCVSQQHARRISSYLKSAANLDIAEKRLPQDGRCKIRVHDKEIDIRISTCPTLQNEKVVLRLLKSQAVKLDVDALGMQAVQQSLFKKTLNQAHGLILVTGPTGSGKTITLYSALHYLNNEQRNITTIEDPVEIKLAGINQININPKINLDFANILRSLLRQDPDIIMIGEIRDTETANIAIRAALTGHLVLATLHTNDAISTIDRLKNMGIAPYNIASALKLIIAQRLVRKLCPSCLGKSCQHCQQGYKGRAGIFEVLTIDDQLANLIATNSTKAEFLQHSATMKFIDFKHAGLELISQKITDKNELNRVL